MGSRRRKTLPATAARHVRPAAAIDCGGVGMTGWVHGVRSGLNDALGAVLSERALDGPVQLSVLCIGTDRLLGDALGPLAGTFLRDAGDLEALGVPVLGTLHNPVHAVNLRDLLTRDRRARSTDPHSLVIAVDSCLGGPDKIGTVYVEPGSLIPGAGLANPLPPVGDLAIRGILYTGVMPEFRGLFLRLALVHDMARAIAGGITLFVRQQAELGLLKPRGTEQLMAD